MRLLPRYSKATGHTCGNPPTHYALVWIEKMARWRCTGCGRIVG